MQKIKTFLLLALFYALSLEAQADLTMPKNNEIKAYLYKRIQNIETKIYNATVESKLIAYKTDSLITTYSAKTFTDRGNSMNFEGNKALKFTPNDLKGINFIIQVQSQPGLLTDHRTLKGLSLMFQPSVGGILLPVQPLGNYKIEDIKSILPENDYQFLLYMYSYTSHTNSYFGFKYPDQDEFYYLNTLSLSYTSIDTNTIEYLTNMLSFKDEYIYNIKELAKQSPDKYMILDEQSKRQISISDVGKTYKQKITVFISTNEDDPTKGYDSTMIWESEITKLGEPTIDSATGKIVFFRTFVESDQLKKAYFTIPVSMLKQYAPMSVIIWFYEDYFKWKPKTAKMNKR